MKVLYVTPFGGFNGAERLLYNLIKRLPKEYSSAVYCSKDGGLVPQLSKLCTTYVKYSEQTKFKFIWHKIIKHAFGVDLDNRMLLWIDRENAPNLWYFNTLNQPDLIALAIQQKIPYAIHVHELSFMYMKLTASQMQFMIQNAKLLIGCSEQVSENLRMLGGKNVRTVHSFIDHSTVSISTTGLQRETYNLPANQFVWVISGGPDYRKGVDIIPRLAQSILGKGQIVWLGPGNSGLRFFVESELKHKGLNNVHFLGERREDYYDLMNMADGFLLTSREDPFPLVMIEAATLGKPIVSFDSGGISEFMLSGMGIVVDDYDIDSFCLAMQSIMLQEYQFDPEVSTNRAKAFDAELKSQEWCNMMAKCFESK